MAEAIEVGVVGPQWVRLGIQEPGGRYPLRVEQSVVGIVERLLPGIITTTTGARYYALHTLAWSEASARNLDYEKAAEFVRRCEVVMAGAYVSHQQSPSGHEREVPSAHGSDRVAEELAERGALDLSALTELRGPRSYGATGYWGAYFAPERTLRLLVGAEPPVGGPRAESLAGVRQALGPVLEVASQESVSAESLCEIHAACPCCTPRGEDHDWLLERLFDPPGAKYESDRSRQVSTLMLLEALEVSPATDIDKAFRVAHGFDVPKGLDDREATIRSAWQAAILRNYSVTAWRNLWRWMSEQIVGMPTYERDVAGALAEAIGVSRVSELVDGIPQLGSSGRLLMAEEEILSGTSLEPLDCLKLLVVGALRTEQLDDQTRTAFLGRENSDLGPAWMADQLANHRDGNVSDLVDDLVSSMFRRAQRVALSKMEMQGTTPYVPGRLKERDGQFFMTSVESDVSVSLRTWTLAQVLAALGAIDRQAGTYRLDAHAESLAARIRTSLARPDDE